VRWPLAATRTPMGAGWDQESGMTRIKGYDGDGIRVTYEADLCIHAAECVRRLPAVFDPGRRPWIEVGAAPAERVAGVVRRCPTGALQYERLDGGADETPSAENELRVIPRGPIYAVGDLVIQDAERREIGRSTRVAFCRCGASRNKPYCDGRHALIGFADDGVLGEPKVRAMDEHARELFIRLRPDGPLVLEGRFAIEGADGTTTGGGGGALCRCGGSGNKPFCDGSHRENGFKAEDPAAR